MGIKKEAMVFITSHFTRSSRSVGNNSAGMSSSKNFILTMRNMIPSKKQSNFTGPYRSSSFIWLLISPEIIRLIKVNNVIEERNQVALCDRVDLGIKREIINRTRNIMFAFFIIMF